ncbi:uncharacterized protein LOC105763753 [Gossypium raimondii]|uniref:uncharacterized protein LOC105763753 n=1 Tax=Gossypium raimondii TaxID=29730 RepID=UPI00063AA731|nr:uncharacterized protein LOC105763753 [Gossypium raimondii]
MPNYVKFMKDIMSKKCISGEFEIVALTEGCTTMLMNKLRPKLKDPRSFTISCSIGNQYIGNILCDLGANINLMPMSVFKRLGIGKARPTKIRCNWLVDPTHIRKVKLKVVRIDQFIFPTDVLILECEADQDVPIILERPFLATGRSLIDVQKGELTMMFADRPGKKFESLDLSDCYFNPPKPSIKEPPTLELKPLLQHLKYASLGNNTLPVVIFVELTSETLTDAQVNYNTTEKELLVVVFAFDKLRSYLVGTKVTVYTDHFVIKYLVTKKDAKLRLIRWILQLQEFDLEVRDRKGTENQVADHL